MAYTLNPGKLTLNDIRTLLNSDDTLALSANSIKEINQARETVEQAAKSDDAVYGINTGFGSLAQTRIDKNKLELLQHSIVVSHAAGTGELLDNKIVKLILLLKINSLARGFSGIRLEVIEALIALYNHQVLPCIPSKGSVGASGDLAPLAHMSIVLLGEGEAYVNGKIIPAADALKHAELKPLTLQAKEGLALLNGTQVSTAIAIYHLLQTEKLFASAIISGAMSIDASLASVIPFDDRIHLARGHKTQVTIAKQLRELLDGSEINCSHEKCDRVQDPYSLRCQPQVMGACLMHLKHAANVLTVEANGVTDNPLVFPKQDAILSGGNFHAEPIAITADLMAICIAEIGAIAERRIALLTDPNHNSGLPAFLVENPGINSGFMLAHVTAAALASENKTLAHPASVDSLPTSANQEDHVSMATFAAKRLKDIIDNVTTIVAIELLAACQGIDLRKPLKTSPELQKYHAIVRKYVSYYSKDRYFAPDIETTKSLILGDFCQPFQFAQ